MKNEPFHFRIEKHFYYQRQNASAMYLNTYWLLQYKILFFFLQEIQQSMSIYLNKTCYNSFALLESITNFFPFDYRQTVF